MPVFASDCRDLLEIADLLKSSSRLIRGCFGNSPCFPEAIPNQSRINLPKDKVIKFEILRGLVYLY